MTNSTTNGNGTNVHTDDEDSLLVTHPYYDVRVAQYIEYVQNDFESENETKYFIRSIGYNIKLRALEYLWKHITHRSSISVPEERGMTAVLGSGSTTGSHCER